jgi:hypothetical protein
VAALVKRRNTGKTYSDTAKNTEMMRAMCGLTFTNT